MFRFVNFASECLVWVAPFFLLVASGYVSIPIAGGRRYLKDAAV